MDIFKRGTRSPSCRTIIIPSLLLAALCSTPASAQLVEMGSTWRYLDDGSDQQIAWRQPTFDDSSWSSGPAQLGYGDNDEATVISYGGDGSNKYTTSYFRHQFNVSTPGEGLTLSVIRDDGVVVYLNGTEVLRSNMPGGTVSANTFASSAVGGSAESARQTVAVDPALLVIGSNTLAAEVHQANLTSSDLSFDLELTNKPVMRGPYLQQASDSQVTVRWRTAVARDAMVRYGTDVANLDQSTIDATVGTEHSVTVTGLSPETRYYYSIGDSAGELLADANQYFDTHPVPGTPRDTRIWILGDSGTANANAAAVRDAYAGYNGDAHADVWLMLGDNAYNDGTDSEYQAAVFDMYPQNLRNSVLWPTLGNHDGHSADSSTQSGPYYDIFHLPTNGESGGMSSGTEAYYSFDYGNIHFICLDSYETDRSANGAMATWLENDLAATSQEWVIAFWHHPPYTKGSHDSDLVGRETDMRSNILPILELYSVDMVLGGHSHSYERSQLIDGHYGTSDTFSSAHIIDGGDGDPLGSGAYQKDANSHSGAIYTVAGSSGKISSAPLDHPVMITNLVELGSMVLDVSGNQLDAVFLNNTGAVRDSFRIVHPGAPTVPAAPQNLSATADSDSQINLVWTDTADNEDSYQVQRSTDENSWLTAATLGVDSESYIDAGLSAATTYFYRVVAVNAAGSSAPSNTDSATTDAPPAVVDYFASSQTTADGVVTGSLTDTVANDEQVQAIREVESGGKKSRRYSLLEHTWQISVSTGGAATLFANAFSSGSSDGDDFDFVYSTDAGSSWQPLFTVASSDPDNLQTSALGTLAPGSVLVRATDTDRTQGNRALDTLSVDELRIQVSAQAGDPPAAPSNLIATTVAATAIQLDWTDNALDELGFELDRKPQGGANWSLLINLGADTSSHLDNSVAPSSSYSYRIRAYNASGSSANSAPASATTADGISLTASGAKTKGVIHNTLSWSGAGASSVDVLRDGSLITNTANDGSYTDNTGRRGGGTFVYRICEPGSTTECSNEAVVAF